MVHTLPDYTSKWKMDKISANIDNAELAARLGSINTFDRRGNVMYCDRCSESLGKWDPGATGDDASITLSDERPYVDDASIKMVGGSTLTRHAYIIKRLPQPHSTRIGVEYLFHISSEVNTIEILFAIEATTGGYRGQIQLDIANDKIYYTESTAEGWTWIADYRFNDSTPLFHSVKLVMDYNTGKYVRLVLSHYQYDLSTYDLFSLAASPNPICETKFEVESTLAKNGILYVGGFIFTANEP